MLISDYLSSDIIICIGFFDSTHFRELGAEMQKYFSSFLVQLKTLRICFRDLLTFSTTDNRLFLLILKLFFVTHTIFF